MVCELCSTKLFRKNKDDVYFAHQPEVWAGLSGCSPSSLPASTGRPEGRGGVTGSLPHSQVWRWVLCWHLAGRGCNTYLQPLPVAAWLPHSAAMASRDGELGKNHRFVRTDLGGQAVSLLLGSV